MPTRCLPDLSPDAATPTIKDLEARDWSPGGFEAGVEGEMGGWIEWRTGDAGLG